MKPYFEKNNIAILSGCNDNYIPYLSVMLKSLMNNFSNENNYDIVLFEFGIKEENKEKILNMACGLENVSIRFCNVYEEIAVSTNTWNIGRWSIELYISLLSPYILKEYSQIVYMDCDVINLYDIAELYKTNLDGYFVGAARLPMRCVFGSNTILSEAGISYYCDSSMDNFMTYFNNGIMLLNLNELRKSYSLEYMIDFISNQNFPLLDQDCINYLCHGKIKFVDAGWNWRPYTRKEFDNVSSLCPSELKDYFARGFSNPKNIHYTIPVKPWLELYGQYFEGVSYFWQAAHETEFYDLIFDKMKEYQVEKDIVNKCALRNWDDLKENCNHKKFYIYGYGKLGKEFLNLYKDIYKPCGIIDEDEKKWDAGSEIPIISIETIKEKHEDVCILISNEQYLNILKSLYKKGYTNLFIYKCMSKKDKMFWQVETNDIKDMHYAFGIFTDKKSKEVYCSLIEKRNNRHIDRSIKYTDMVEGNTYFRNDFCKCGDSEVYVDVGSYNGCTIQFFLKHVGNRYKKIIAFEADSYNYDLLNSSISGDNIYSYNIGLDKENTEKYYDHRGYGTCISDHGNEIVNCMKLDDCILDEQVTFIKINVPNTMDVLAGAENTIKKFTPKLAVCVSHNYADLWEVPAFLKKLVPEYRLYLRHHSTDMSMSVIYAE